MLQHLNIKIYGLVQGIFYRVTAKEIAEQLGIKGFAKNESDGSVYIEAEGQTDDLDKFLKWCHIGPSLAKVERVKVKEDKLKDFSQFIVF